MKHIKLYYILFFCIMSCESQALEHKDKDAKTETKQNKNVMEDTVSVQFLKMNTYAEALKKYGSPINKENYKLNEVAITEFRVRLLNIFDKQERLKPIEIQEVTWNQNTTQNVTVWYTLNSGIWTPIDVMSWDKGAEF